MEDIRAFFGAPKAGTAAAAAQSTKQTKGKKLKRVVLSDSDDENDTLPVSKKAHTDNSSSSLTSISNKQKAVPVPKPAMKPTTADDFFSSAPVSQVRRDPHKNHSPSKLQDRVSDTAPSLKKSPTKTLVDLTSPSKKPKHDEKRPSNLKIAEKKQTPSKPKSNEVHPDSGFMDALNDLDNRSLPNKSSMNQSNTVSAPEETRKTCAKSERTPSKSSTSTTRTPSKLEDNVSSASPITPGFSNSSRMNSDSPAMPLAPPNTIEKESAKKNNYAAYLSFQNRSGPQALGTKQFPRGPDDCLSGKSFVLTGVLESFERDDVKSFVERHGGKVANNVSKNTSYVVLGREPGPAKVTKIEQLKIKTLDEDGLLLLVETAVQKPNFEDKKSQVSGELKKSDDHPSTASPDEKKSLNATSSRSKHHDQKKLSAKDLPQTISRISSSISSTSKVATGLVASTDTSAVKPGHNQLWVDKYQAKTMKQIIGQQGDKSNAKKLHYWLKNWHGVFTQKNYRGPLPNKDNGLLFKAALLSGNAGVGKTTTATIVSKDLGMEIVAMNASDTRSQKLLNTVVAETLKSGSLTNLMSESSTGASDLNHVLIMDEVDGMAGNEDRGGMSELINLIKKSKIPIICICNDRQHQKVRSLANHCLDLRFQRPRLEQLKSAMLSIAFKEGIKASPNAIEQLIIGANQDVRQVIHHLQSWFASQKSLSYDQAKAKSQRSKKDQKMGPFDACRVAFSFGEERRKMSFNDKMDLFFYDYSLMPLFMQENYLQTTMNRGSAKDVMRNISRAADSFVMGDQSSKIMRTINNWSLLPKIGAFTCVYPGEMCQGPMGQFVGFPRWLGENSKRGKNDRLLQEMQVHMRLHFNANKKDLNLQILPVLRQKFASCLADESRVEDGVKLLTEMDLTREDLDTVFSMSQMTDADDPWKKMSSKSKAAFTRLFNKTSHKLPYVAVGGKKRKVAAASLDSEFGEEGEEAGAADDAAEEDDDYIPGLISKKVPTKTGTNSGKAASYAGKGASKKPAASKTKKDTGSTKKKAPTKKK